MPLTERALNSPEENHLKRLAVAYQVAAVGLIGLGTFWLVWMSSERVWNLAALNFCYIGAGLLLWRRIRIGKFHSAAALVHLAMYLVIVEICLVYDIPSPAAPRTCHLYFLAMAFLFYVTFRRIHLGMTYAVVLIYLATFIVFSSTSFGLPFAEPLPDGVRVVGGWVHSIMALTIMCTCIYIMQSDHATRTRFGRQIAAALAEEQFELYFQPQVDRDGRITGAEALLRWNHPDHGMVAPGEFIPAAEQLGIMRLIGKWVLNAACARLAAWQADPASAHLTLSVNISPQQFYDANFVAEVKAVVGQHGVDPQRLELELTENIVVRDLEDVIAKMHALSEFGIALSLDDFGTGYSSLKYLKRMPITQVKIDQSFVRDMVLHTRDATIVKGIIQLGREMHLSVMAEGVETLQQREFLIELGCHEFQGFLFGRPVPASEFAGLVAMRGGEE
jgi:EAL domain-containing protein (putative c-di-GMP-specific phosphodiesterase class I)